MTARLCLVLILGSALAAGCVSNSRSLALAEPPPGGSTIAAAAPAKVHALAARVVTARFSRRLEELPTIELQITNRGSESIEFRPEAIEALADTTLVKIYSVPEYMLLVERSVQSDYAAADATERSALVGTGFSRYGPTTTPMISAKLAGAQERANIKDHRTKLLGALVDMLYPNIVAPGETFKGVIRLRAAPLLSAERLRLRVPIGSEIHEVTFVVNPT